ncbi:serine threonine isoform B [Micractinium conductrix]|uniref:Serine threonine isoform B n=1 Tax=Micractinium conductrix TaxID=554055 RepID=A0A2P6V3R9_9CHLO|nr:serine threonine isoform B [Micractinium conductrix]|eukprot:PSC68739.1 serine threonine isoform B [Micractinium conductrix]
MPGPPAAGRTRAALPRTVFPVSCTRSPHSFWLLCALVCGLNGLCSATKHSGALQEEGGHQQERAATAAGSNAPLMRGGGCGLAQVLPCGELQEIARGVLLNTPDWAYYFFARQYAYSGPNNLATGSFIPEAPTFWQHVYGTGNSGLCTAATGKKWTSVVNFECDTALPLADGTTDPAAITATLATATGQVCAGATLAGGKVAAGAVAAALLTAMKAPNFSLSRLTVLALGVRLNTPAGRIFYSVVSGSLGSGIMTAAAPCAGSVAQCLPTSPGQCASGRYIASGGKLCALCAAGRSCAAGTATALACAAGNIAAKVGLGACTKCPAGDARAVGIGVGILCSPCPAGRFGCWRYNMHSLRPSSFTASPRSAACTACAAGHVTGPLPGGTADANRGATACKPCAKRTYRAASAPGNKCVACEAGYETKLASAAAICTICSTGTTHVAATDVVCTACQPGFYTNAAGRTGACPQCPKGHYCPTAKTTSPTACPAGKYNGSAGSRVATACKPCPKNTFSKLAGAARCASCPTGTTTSGKTGQTKCTASRSTCAAAASADATTALADDASCGKAWLLKACALRGEGDALRAEAHAACALQLQPSLRGDPLHQTWMDSFRAVHLEADEADGRGSDFTRLDVAAMTDPAMLLLGPGTHYASTLLLRRRMVIIGMGAPGEVKVVTKQRPMASSTQSTSKRRR